MKATRTYIRSPVIGEGVQQCVGGNKSGKAFPSLSPSFPPLLNSFLPSPSPSSSLPGLSCL